MWLSFLYLLQNLVIPPTQDVDVLPLTLSFDDAEVEQVYALPSTSVDWSAARIEGQGPLTSNPTPDQSEEFRGDTGRRFSASRRRSREEVCTDSSLSASSLGKTDRGGAELETIKQPSSSYVDSSFLRSVEADSIKKKSKVSNLVSMCLASDCKHTAVPRKLPESGSKSHSVNKGTKKRQEHTISQTDKTLQLPHGNDRSIMKPDTIPDLAVPGRGSNAGLESSLDVKGNRSRADSLESPASIAEDRYKDKSVETGVDKNRCNQELINTNVEAGDGHTQKRTMLKDTAVQTSLDLDGFVVDITEGGACQEMLPKEPAQDGEKAEIKVMTDAFTENKNESEFREEERSDVSENHSELRDFVGNKKKTIDFKDDQEIKEEHKNNCQKTEVKKTEIRRPSKVFLLRSKSVHGDGGGGDRNKDRTLPSEASNLSGNVRELSHLNIDVSQRLVGGERRFVVSNGSPELQVMVNALTPVLSRRSRARNSRRQKNPVPVEELPNATPTSCIGQEMPSPPISERVNSAKLSRLDTVTSVTDNLGGENDSTCQGHTLLATTGPQSPYGSLRENENSDQSSPKYIPFKNQDGLKGRKEIYEMSKTAGKADFSDAETSDGLDSNEAEMLQVAAHQESHENENEKGKKSLFMNPKLTHTWHGPSSSSGYRSASILEAAQIFRQGVKFTCEPDGRIRPVASSPSSPVPYYQENSLTMPVISRTLLDALHKRYCSHQYSSQYHTLQPFSVLRLDPTFSSRNNSVAAVLLQPRPAREHAVHAAPPSPQIMARLRLLSAAGDSSKKSIGCLPPPPPPPQTDHPEDILDPTRPRQSSQELFLQQTAPSGDKTHLEVVNMTPGLQLQEDPSTETPDSSPVLQDVSTQSHLYMYES